MERFEARTPRTDAPGTAEQRPPEEGAPFAAPAASERGSEVPDVLELARKWVEDCDAAIRNLRGIIDRYAARAQAQHPGDPQHLDEAPAQGQLASMRAMLAEMEESRQAMGEVLETLLALEEAEADPDATIH